jgi:two-component system, NarL family, sensor histidine kinase BarA
MRMQTAMPSITHFSTRATLRLLAVDDVVMNLTLLGDVVALAGFALDTAASAAEGLRLAQLNRYALLLLDIQLPDFNGDTLLLRLRADTAAASQRSPAFALTGELNAALRLQLLQTGFIEVFGKPWAQSELLSAVQNVAGIRARSHTSLLPSLSPAVSEQNPLFDHIQALKTTGGDEKLMLKLRGLLITDLTSRIELMRAAFAQQDWQNLNEHRHKLAGAAGFTGAIALAAALDTLKANADEGSFARVESAIRAILNSG